IFPFSSHPPSVQQRAQYSVPLSARFFQTIARITSSSLMCLRCWIARAVLGYYAQSESPTPGWALPEVIATSKLEKWAHQDEFRFLFSLTDALTFQNVDTQL